MGIVARFYLFYNHNHCGKNDEGMGQSGLHFRSSAKALLRQPGCASFYEQLSSVMCVRNFVCASELFGLDQLCLSRKGGRLENGKIIAEEIMKQCLRNLLMCLSEALN